LLPRILASRAAGVRVVLPSGRPHPTALSVGSAAAAVVLLAIGWLLVGIVAPRRSSDWISHRPVASEFLERSPLFVSTGYAQEVRDTLGRAKYRLLDRTGNTHLMTGVWTYRSTLTVDGLVTTPQGSRRFSIATGPSDRGPAWIVATEGKGTYARRLFWDTLVVSQEDLRISRRTTPFAIEPRPPEHPRDPSNRFLSWRYADVGWLGSVYRALFQLERLDRDWRGSVYLPWVHGERGELVSNYALNMKVDGEERLTVPAGTFDASRIGVEGRRGVMTVWVSRDSNWIVKIAIPSGSDAVWEEALVSTTPPTP
jgi:hypothetical protein